MRMREWVELFDEPQPSGIISELSVGSFVGVSELLALFQHE